MTRAKKVTTPAPTEATKATKAPKAPTARERAIKLVADRIYKNTIDAYGTLFGVTGGGGKGDKNSLITRVASVLGSNNFSGHQNSVIRLMAAILDIPEGELREQAKLRGSTDGVAFVAMTALVPVNNPNSHNYPLNKAAIVMSDRNGCLRMSDGPGNNMPVNISSLRLPTRDEVKAVVTANIETLERVVVYVEVEPEAKKATA